MCDVRPTLIKEKAWEKLQPALPPNCSFGCRAVSILWDRGFKVYSMIIKLIDIEPFMINHKALHDQQISKWEQIEQRIKI